MPQEAYEPSSGPDTEPGRAWVGDYGVGRADVNDSGVEAEAPATGLVERERAFEVDDEGGLQEEEVSDHEETVGVATLEIDPNLMAKALQYFPDESAHEVDGSPRRIAEEGGLKQSSLGAQTGSQPLSSPRSQGSEDDEVNAGRRGRGRGKNRGGRPRKKDPLRNRRYVYFTDQEAAMVSAKAEADSRKVSSYIRSRVLAQQVASEKEISDLLNMLIRAKKAVDTSKDLARIAPVPGDSAMPYPTYRPPGSEGECSVDLDEIVEHLESAQALVVEMMRRAAALTSCDES